jgi:hypothetical protein
VIVTVLVDLGVKYLSKVFSPDWLSDNGIAVDPDEDDKTEERLEELSH